MKRILAAILLVPAVLLIGLSMWIDPEPGAEVITEYVKMIADKAGLRLVE